MLIWSCKQSLYFCKVFPIFDHWFNCAMTIQTQHIHKTDTCKTNRIIYLHGTRCTPFCYFVLHHHFLRTSSLRMRMKYNKQFVVIVYILEIVSVVTGFKAFTVDTSIIKVQHKAIRQLVSCFTFIFLVYVNLIFFS